jgi:hypothetical protein
MNSPLNRDLVSACKDLRTTSDLSAAVEHLLQVLEQQLYEQKEVGAALAVSEATPTIVERLHRDYGDEE